MEEKYFYLFLFLLVMWHDNVYYTFIKLIIYIYFNNLKNSKFVTIHKTLNLKTSNLYTHNLQKKKKKIKRKEKLNSMRIIINES